MSDPTSSIPGMRQGYGEAALAQGQALLAGLPQAQRSLFAPLCQCSGGVLRVVDLGSADGVNSFPVVGVLRRLMAGGGTLSVEHLDLPGGDFNGLVRNLYEHPASYLAAEYADGLEVRPLLVPASFYDSPLAESSVDLAFSTTALHYASTRASGLTGHIDPLYANLPEEQAAWLKLSRIDLDRLMAGLTRCVRPSGKIWLVVPTCLRDSAGALRNHWYREAKNLLNQQLEALACQGVVEWKLLNDFVIPTHERDLEQWQSWFAAHQSQWRLEFATVRELPNPYLERWSQHRDNELFATEYLASIRAWSERILLALVAEPLQRETVFRRLYQQFAAQPELFAYDNVSVYLGATRLA